MGVSQFPGSSPAYTMNTPMVPPPPEISTSAEEDSTSESAKAAPMDPPRSRNPNPSKPDAGPSENSLVEPELNPAPSDTSTLDPSQLTSSTDGSNDAQASDKWMKHEQWNRNAAVPYTIPPWSGPPGHRFFIEVLKDGAIVDQHEVNKKGAYMFGRVDLCDFVLEHPTISRFHAVLQFKSNGGAYLYDLGSTHGTSINKSQVKKRDYVDLHVGDVIRFGLSSRLYIFQGPPDLMPPEADLKSLRTAKIRQERQDMEASLLRAKVASLADGISWGMQEDAIEENEDDVDEITWQTYKGQLTEKQEKTREKVIKRLEKIAHMKKEIDAIRVKDIAQGGLTQGQQTQIARNEQRISQIMEELENLEETLNESIRESISAKAGKLSRGKKKGAMEDDEDDYLSDDDEFYDRTKKSSKHKAGENQSVETAYSLLDKKDCLMKQLQDKEKLLHEDDKSAETNAKAEASDALDAYMSAVSSQLVLDRKDKLQKEISTLQTELDRILYLLGIADPTGEAAKKRESKVQNPKTIVIKKPSSDIGSRSLPQNNLKINFSSSKIKKLTPEASLAESNQNIASVNSKSEPNVKKEGTELKNDEHEPTVYTVTKPQWLGAVEDRQKQESTPEVSVDTQDTTDQFVDYKDREKIVNITESLSSHQEIEDAPSGLIIRKRKQVEKSKASEEVKDRDETNDSNGVGFKAEDAVALLLKHSRGYHASGEEDGSFDGDVMVEKEGKKDGKKAKRASGPEKPSTWVPPEGQSGDGRTSLNDRFGY